MAINNITSAQVWPYCQMTSYGTQKKVSPLIKRFGFLNGISVKMISLLHLHSRKLKLREIDLPNIPLPANYGAWSQTQVVWHYIS